MGAAFKDPYRLEKAQVNKNDWAVSGIVNLVHKWPVLYFCQPNRHPKHYVYSESAEQEEGICRLSKKEVRDCFRQVGLFGFPLIINSLYL